ncbi:AbrB/MazE/SpoVT family DNA-binding domain-containing protein [Paenibacillus jiagnxiensis]|uniref:AbrB/MazE/SpoVT family DNA-binding domain-containing protein n=1 Tax=Paenibacillus jiagnxiensis TaxID=3228926 RepID=UPI0033A2F3A1
MLITIPYSARYRLGLDDQGSRIQYVEHEGSFEKFYWIEPVQQPMFPFGKQEQGYRVTSQGQVTVPKYILETLQIQNKEELWIDFDVDNRRLSLRKSHVHRFQEILLSLRPNFYEDRENELLTIVGRDEAAEGDDRLLFVERSQFNQLCRLYRVIKERYEAGTNTSWVGVPDVGDQGISINLDETVVPSQLIVTKLGDKYLSDPMVAKLWRERIPFHMIDNKISYYNEGKKQEHDVTPRKAREIMQIFNRNAKQYGSFKDSTGQFVETVLFYTGDMVIYRRINKSLEFLPKQTDE